MKKAYVKPEMFYENFELSHNIANCSIEDGDTRSEAHFSDANTCFYEYVVGNIFNQGTSGCDAKFEEIPDLQQYCYQTGSFGVTFFHS